MSIIYCVCVVVQVSEVLLHFIAPFTLSLHEQVFNFDLSEIQKNKHSNLYQFCVL